MGRIPEIIDLDVQTEKLALIAADEHFRFIRERCGGDFLAVLDAEMKGTDGLPKAPSRGVEELKKFLDATAIVRGKIAQLERDGFTIAGYEIRKALTYPGYRMLGETEPFAKTTPITLAMFHPEVTLQVLARMHRADQYWCKIEDVPKDLYLPFHRRSGEVIFFKELLDSLHDLNAPMFTKLERSIGKTKRINRIRNLSESVILPNRFKKQRTKISYSFAVICYAQKNVVLRCFTKKEQEQIAVWQFNLPKAYAGKAEHHLYFGLHLEAERNYWLNKRRPFCSSNTFHGYGAIAYPGEAYHCFDKKSERFKGTRILLSS